MSSGSFLKGIAFFTAVCGAIGVAYATWEQIFRTDEPIEIVLVQPGQDGARNTVVEPRKRDPQKLVEFQVLATSLQDEIDQILSAAIVDDFCGVETASISSYSEEPGSGIREMKATLISASIDLRADKVLPLRVTGNGMAATETMATHQAREDFLSTLKRELQIMADTCAEGRSE